MKKIVCLFLGLVVMILSCQKNPKLSDSEKGTILKAVQRTSQQFWSYTQPYDTGSFRRFVKFWDENSDKIWQTEPVTVVFETDIIKTRSEWVKMWKDMIDQRISTVPIIHESHFSVLSSDKVLEVNKGDFTITGKDSVVYGPFTMVNTVLWTNTNGDWRMQYFHESSVKKSE
jgi:hypothetical protein